MACSSLVQWLLSLFPIGNMGGPGHFKKFRGTRSRAHTSPVARDPRRGDTGNSNAARDPYAKDEAASRRALAEK
jgi:hypothetical protein